MGVAEAYYLNDCWHDEDDEGNLIPNNCDPQLSGDVVCADCYNSEPDWQCPDGNDHPVHGYNAGETDYPQHCDHCHELLDVFYLTNEGMTYVHDEVMEAVERAATYDRWQAQRDHLTLQGMAWSEPPRPRTTHVYEWWDAWSDYDYLDLPRMAKALGIEDNDDPDDYKDDIVDAIEDYLAKYKEDE